MKFWMGFDPDTKAAGWAAILEDKGIHTYKVGVLRVSGKLEINRRVEMADSIYSFFETMPLSDGEFGVEWQHLRPGREKNPNSMMAVQAVAGMILGCASQVFLKAQIYMPLPYQWRGTMSKEIVQKRILTEAGKMPNTGQFETIIPSLRTHAIDALGLALWLMRGRKLP